MQNWLFSVPLLLHLQYLGLDTYMQMYTNISIHNPHPIPRWKLRYVICVYFNLVFEKKDFWNKEN